ncbi:MAG: efflux RND transporter periplasmic adaptor subunit [Candidatus Ancaeobacter aquaticus]|nr:efflux RND transporter periplasmic adaptor subunit [Candidatus Ancaeobacter aquaticus]
MHSKNIVSIVLCAIFLILIGYGVYVFTGMYFQSQKLGRQFVEVSGRIEGKEYHAATKVAGRVDELYVKESDTVKAGQIVALIYSEQREAMLGRSEARLKEAQANLELAELEYERYKKLYEENAVPKMEFDHVNNRYTLKKEAVIGAQKEVEKRQADLKDLKIVAPISGTVVTKIVRKGEVIAEGTPIISIINMNELYLKVFLATDKAGKVSLGDQAKIYPDSYPDEAFDAYVNKIAQKAEFTPKNVETKSQRAKLVFQIKLKVIDNTDSRLKPGMPSDAVIKIDKAVSWDVYKK